MKKRFLAVIATLLMVMTMVPAVAFAGTTVTTEAELQNAVNAGGEITIGNDMTLAGTITVPAGKTVTIDLNGNTISGACGSSQAHMFMVENTATLNIKDTSTAGDGKITYSGSSSTGWIVDVEGTFNLYSGTLELTGTWSIGYCVDVRPNSWGTEYTEGTVFHMYGGKLISSDGAVRVASSSASAHDKVSATFIMDGGSIEAEWDGIFVQQSDSVYDALSVIINDGTVSSDLAPIRFYGPAATGAVGDNDNPMNLTITGGSFEYTGNGITGDWLVPGVFKLGGGATEEDLAEELEIAISGGTFDADVSEYVEAGFEWDEETGEVINPNSSMGSAGGGEAGTESTAPTTPSEAAPADSTPKTGDDFNGAVPFALAALAAAAMAAAVMSRRQRQN